MPTIDASQREDVTRVMDAIREMCVKPDDLKDITEDWIGDILDDPEAEATMNAKTLAEKIAFAIDSGLAGYSVDRLVEDFHDYGTP